MSWGHQNYGGDSWTIREVLTGVETIFSTSYAFAALLKNGTVATWGNKYGGDPFRHGFFFYVHLDVLVATWSLPPATFSYQNIHIPQKGVQRLSRSLPAATWNYQKR